jgi:hypothetical protein
LLYSVELILPYSPTLAGKVRLRVSKDRNGGVGAAGQVITEISFTPSNGITEVKFERPTGGPFVPTALMGKICKHLEISPDASQNDLRKLGKSQYVDQAIHELHARAHIGIGSKGQRKTFTVFGAL